ncbi:MAG: hypothetical protein H6Q74_2216 [Firmicutes bacterium]|nr:hypothetical protein [Bacillota bacterium]
MPAHYNDENLSEITNKFLKIFTVQPHNYLVDQGDFYKVDLFKLCNEGLVNSCFGNNSDNPYFACVMPPAPCQTVPNLIEIENGKYMAFRLGFNEAIVIIGKTPPEVNYFSYCAFLTSRFSERKNNATKDFPITPLRNKPIKDQTITREVVFSCLGEPLNNLKINTPGTPNGTPGCPFDQPFLIVCTANQNLQQEIYKFALHAGFSSDSLNTIIIPQAIANLGVNDRNTDTFTIINRISSRDEYDAKLYKYLHNPGVNVLRVTANTTKGTAFPIPFLTPRGTGRTEFRYSKPVDDLRTKIIEYYNSDYEAVDITTDIWLDESYIALQQGLNNLGEARDTVYLGTGSFKLPQDAFVVVYGVNHAKTGKCTYSNIVAYGNKYDNGVVSVSNQELENSAFHFSKEPDTGYLYAWRFGFYEDPSYNYTQIPTYNTDELILKNQPNTRKINPDEDIYFGFRAYLEPSTKVGPACNELILDRVLVFLKKKLIHDKQLNE